MIIEGLQTKRVNVLVTREEIRNYCYVIGEECAIYHNVEAANLLGYADLVIPITYPSLFWQYIEIPWLSSKSLLILSGQSFHSQETLIANRAYTCYILLNKVRKSKDKQFLQHKLYVTYNEKIVSTNTTTLAEV